MSACEESPRGFVSKAEYYRALAEIDRLKEELAHAREEAQPEHDMASILAVQRAVRTPKQRARLLLTLLRRPSATNAGLVAGGDCTDSRELKVLICLLRRELRNAGAPDQSIQTFWGLGYGLTEQGRAWLRDRVPEAFSEKGASR